MKIPVWVLAVVVVVVGGFLYWSGRDAAARAAAAAAHQAALDSAHAQSTADSVRVAVTDSVERVSARARDSLAAVAASAAHDASNARAIGRAALARLHGAELSKDSTDILLAMLANALDSDSDALAAAHRSAVADSIDFLRLYSTIASRDDLIRSLRKVDSVAETPPAQRRRLTPYVEGGYGLTVNNTTTRAGFVGGAGLILHVVGPWSVKARSTYSRASNAVAFQALVTRTFGGTADGH